MNLQSAIADALALTADLLAVLPAGEPAACADLLTRRGVAMTACAEAHRAADATEREACRTALQELAARDQALQAAAAAALAEAGARIRQTVGAAPRPTGNYARPPALACVDRKA